MIENGHYEGQTRLFALWQSQPKQQRIMWIRVFSGA